VEPCRECGDEAKVCANCAEETEIALRAQVQQARALVRMLLFTVDLPREVYQDITERYDWAKP
jgi:hypothetical protein